MRYTIRRTRPDDAAAILRLRTAPGVVRNTLQQPYQSLHTLGEQLRATPEHVHSLVACSPDGEVIANGGLVLALQARRRHCADLFLMVRDDWQGKGVGSALLTALLDLADNWLALKRIALDAVHDNAGAIALYRRFGFEQEGVARGFNLREGIYEDGVLMARTRFADGEHAVHTAPASHAVPAGNTRHAPRPAIRLRAGEPGDAEAFTALMAHESAYGNTLQLPYPDINIWQQRLQQPGRLVLVAEDEHGRVVGHSGTFTLSDNPRRAHGVSFGITVAADCHGLGIGNRLLGALLQQLRDYQPYRRVELTVFADNAAAIALYRRHGFEAEAVLRGDAFRHGVYSDSLQMALQLPR